jgi:hypothetical protein
MVVIVALVLFGVLAFVGSRRPPAPKHSVRAAASSIAHTATSAPTSPPTSSTGSGTSHHGGTTKPKRKTKSTPTTEPTQIAATSVTSSTAVYPVSSSTYRVTVIATGPCWVDATNASTGSTLWAGTLQAGAVQQIQASGIVRVDLGTPAASLTIDGVPVTFPTPLRSPFVATFEPPATTPAAGATSSTTTPTVTSTTSAP